MMQFLWKVLTVIYVKFREWEAAVNDDDAFDPSWMDYAAWQETRIRT